eukprot:CAMPEP_0182912324 /NCGR_PEP_ID=MMETSP0034_2-20130328/37454_1 /TAXON_ID=156128 /ORGANISM="Nephroselmis pyriformis, Strain CCMP717" /LENGTH=184 /DNA_ID=CAMNT_0025048989 /DNA_START=16 /DNA_END=570 /DNA_ORIENTATION=-
MAQSICCQSAVVPVARATAASSSRNVVAARVAVNISSASINTARFGGASLSASRASISATRASSAIVAAVASETPAPAPLPKAPKGMGRYESMIIARPNLDEDAMESYIAKLEAFLASEGASEVEVVVRGRQRMSYPIDGFWEGVYVMVSYVSKPKVSHALQTMLDAPVIGDSKAHMRYMTHRV